MKSEELLDLIAAGETLKLKRLVEQGKLELVGRGRAAHYRVATDALEDAG